MHWLSQRFREAYAATTFLTRLRLPGMAPARLPLLADAVWVFPLVGVLVGGVSGLGAWLALVLGLPAISAALVAVTLSMLMTGALHEDGWSDFWDGLGGGRSRERKLEIMRDSRIGTYGALSLIISVSARAGAIAALPVPVLVPSLIAAHALARFAMAVIWAGLSPARRDGLAHGAGTPERAASLVGLAVSAAIAWGCLGWGAVPAIIGVVMAVAAVALLARRYLGGFTGDVLGAGEQAGELAALLVLAALLTP